MTEQAPRERASQAVPVLAKNGLTAFGLHSSLEPGRHTLTVVVKATLDVVVGAEAVLREESDPPSGDLHHHDEPGGSVVYPSDFAVIKPRCEVLLRGHAYPSRERGAAFARFAFGRGKRGFDRRIAVFGARRWQALGQTPPRPFEAIALVYENAFGGSGHRENPVGQGLAGDALPLLEDPTALLAARTDRPRPMSFCGASQLWPGRHALLGSYADWHERYPHFAADFDPAFFLSAPREQQLDTIAGDESFILAGVHPEHPVIQGKLPALTPRCFAQQTETGGSAFAPVALTLDTVVFDADALTVNLVWRALVAVADDEASDVEEIYVTLEPLEPRDAERSYRVDKALGEGLDLADAEAQAANVVDRDHAVASARHDQRARDRLLAHGLDESLLVPSEVPPSDAPGTSVGESLFPDSAALGAREEDAVRQRAMALLAADAPLDDSDLSGGDLSELDFSGRSLVGARLKESRLVGCRFERADLRRAVLAGANLTDAVLAGAQLEEADFSEATLDGASLAGASMDDAELSGVIAPRLDLREARGVRVRFTGADLTAARFDGAELAHAELIDVRFEGASFEAATMPDLRLYDAAGKVSFRGATMPNARADGAALAGSDLSATSADGAIFDGAELERCSFAHASLRGAGFVKARCSAAIFGGSDLSEARLARATLERANLIGANLMQASLEAANLHGADLRGANLYAAELHQTDLSGADLTDAYLAKTKVEGR